MAVKSQLSLAQLREELRAHKKGNKRRQGSRPIHTAAAPLEQSKIARDSSNTVSSQDVEMHAPNHNRSEPTSTDAKDGGTLNFFEDVKEISIANRKVSTYEKIKTYLNEPKIKRELSRPNTSPSKNTRQS